MTNQTEMVGFEPTLSERYRFQIYLLNHSATSKHKHKWSKQIKTSRSSWPARYLRLRSRFCSFSPIKAVGHLYLQKSRYGFPCRVLNRVDALTTEKFQNSFSLVCRLDNI